MFFHFVDLRIAHEIERIADDCAGGGKLGQGAVGFEDLRSVYATAVFTTGGFCSLTCSTMATKRGSFAIFLNERPAPPAGSRPE